MILSLIVGLGLPLLGTTAGAACVFFMKKQMNLLLQIRRFLGGVVAFIYFPFAYGSVS